MTSKNATLHNEVMRKGQALVVVLLIMGVLATVGLSVMTRSVTEVRESTIQEESARALEAAEVGLEKYLGQVGPTPGILTEVAGGEARFSLSQPQNIGLAPGYKVPYPLLSGDVATLDLNGLPNNIGVALCWGLQGETEVPAMVASLYYRVGDEFRVKSRGFDPASRVSGWIVPGGSSTCGLQTNFAHRQIIRFNANGAADINVFSEGGTPLFLRVRMVFNNTQAYPVGFDSISGADFPLQAGSIESVGSAGDAVQRIRAVVPDYDLPAVFDSAIFSGSGLVK